MDSVRRTIGLVLLAGAAVTVLGGATARAKDLPSDDRILSGKLANGLTWKYRRHDNPPGKMAFLLHVRSGSLNETDAQRGLAHFIEHMCFNGTEHFAPGELIPYFESIGMEFGADLNAFTSFDQTAYMLFTPNTEAEQIDKALTVLSDYAFRALILDEEVDKERGVVLEESRAGKSAQQRIRDKLWPKLFKGTRFAERLPIGLEEVLATAPTKELRDYYRAWYRPENMTLVLVGDADPKPIIPMIEKWFGAYRPSGAARKPHGPEFKPFHASRAFVETDPEMATCRIQLFKVKEGRPPTTTESRWREGLVESVAGWIMGRRFDDLVSKGKASFRFAGVGIGDFFNDALLVSGSAGGEPDEWDKMLSELIVEIKRARVHGITEHELELAKKELLAGAERAVRTEPTRNARGIAFQIMSGVQEREPVLSAAQELELHKKLLPTVTLDEVVAVGKKHFGPEGFAYVVTMGDKPGIDVPTTDAVLEAGQKAWATPVESIHQEEAATAILSELPKPGKTVETERDADLDITSAWLSNGVRFHHRFMDYKKDQVLVTISLAGGEIEETAENAGITEVATLAFREAATSKINSSQMRDLMTGKNIRVNAFAGGDTFAINVIGSPKDLEAGLQKVYALLTDGIIEESAFKNWKLSTLQRIEQLEKFPRFKAFEAMSELISGGDPRFTTWTKERVEKQSPEKAQAWFNRLRREAPIEVAVVGDIPLKEVQPLIERYVGSLPTRSRTAEHLDKLRKLAREKGPLMRHVDVETMTPQAVAITGFVSCERKNVTDRRAMELAEHVLSSRLVKRIREDLSIVYSIRAGNRPSAVYEDSGQFAAGAPCDPKNVETLLKEVRGVFEEFGKNGPTDEELANAKKQVLENLDTQMKEPSYWSRVLSNMTLRHRTLAEQKEEKAAFEPFTPDQVRVVFAKYNTPERQFAVAAVPTLVPTADKKDDGSPAS